jgi:hypothetical protein
MEPELTRPGFLASYFDAMKDRARIKGWRAVVPYWLFIGAAFGVALAAYLPAELWTSQQNWQVIVAMYAAMVTINGLLLALSWSAFARIHELIVSSDDFTVFLRQARLFNTYIFYIDYVQFAQIVALIITGSSMFISIIPMGNILWQKGLLAWSIMSSVYAIKYAVNAVTVMHDLVWQKAVFLEHEAEHQRKVVRLNQ